MAQAAVLVFVVVAFCSVFVGGLVAAAVAVQRDWRLARFVHRHRLPLWLALSAVWAVVAVVHFVGPSHGLGNLLGIVSVVLSTSALVLALVTHRLA